MSQFPNIVDGSEPIRTEPVGSRHNRRKVRIVTEAAPSLKARLDALSMETSISVAEICRHALWSVVLEADVDKVAFCQKLAGAKMKHAEQERIR